MCNYNDIRIFEVQGRNIVFQHTGNGVSDFPIAVPPNTKPDYQCEFVLESGIVAIRVHPRAGNPFLVNLDGMVKNWPQCLLSAIEVVGYDPDMDSLDVFVEKNMNVST